MKTYARATILVALVLTVGVLAGGCNTEKKEVAQKLPVMKKAQPVHPQPMSMDTITADLREGIAYLKSRQVGPNVIQFDSGRAYFQKERATLDSNGKWTGTERPTPAEVKASIIMAIRELSVGYLEEVRSGSFDESREQIIAITRDAGTYANYVINNTDSSDLKRYIAEVFPLFNQAQLHSSSILLDDGMNKFIKLDKSLFAYTGGNLLRIAEEFSNPYDPPSTPGVKIRGGIMVEYLNHASILPVQRKAAVRGWLKAISHTGVGQKGIIHFQNVEELKNIPIYSIEDQDISRKMASIQLVSIQADQMGELPELKWYVDDMINLLKLAKTNRSRHQYYHALIMINELNEAIQPKAV